MGPSPAKPGGGGGGAVRKLMNGSSDDLGRVLGFMRVLWQLDHALESASRKMKARVGVTGPERLVVRIVGQRPGISAGELARVMHLHPSSLTPLVKRLVSRRLVERRSDPADARKALLTLSARGREVDRHRSGTVESGVRGALDKLSGRDVAAAEVVLTAIANALDGHCR
jgi:MarR family transcriptional regulator, organic hydroperoxide resistance regulator